MPYMCLCAGGGVTHKVKDGLWFEEYASQDIDEIYVLNGHNFALNGVWYLSKYDSFYKDLFNKGTRALEILLPKFDANVWSKYDLYKIPANPKYHQIHIDQLNTLYNRTGNEVFKKYADKFNFYKYLPFSSFYRLINYPNNFLILQYFINFIISMIIILVFKKIFIDQSN